MMRHQLCVLTLVMAGCVALVLPAAVGCSGAQAQAPSAPPGHRQPRVGDVPRDSSQQDTARSPEDIARDRALNNICRGCLPIIPVREVPRYDIANSCAVGSAPSNDTCRKDEETARQRLKDQWKTFTEKARSDCVQSNEIGGRPSYVQLGICLRTMQVAPTLPEGR